MWMMSNSCDKDGEGKRREGEREGRVDEVEEKGHKAGGGKEE